MLKIGEFSKLTHVSVRMLRYYDNHGLLTPSYIDDISGYRMYSVEQVPNLQKIILLRDLNFSVQEITDMLNHWNDDFLLLQMNHKIGEIEKNIQIEQAYIEGIKATISHIQRKQIDLHYNVIVKSVPTYKVISLRKKILNYFCEGELWQELYHFVKQEHIELKGSHYNNIAIYHDQEHAETEVDVEVCFVVKRIGRNKEPFTFRELEGSNLMASMMVYGKYDNIAEAYQSFIQWLAAHQNYQITSPNRQISIIGHEQTNNPEDYLTEIQIPLI